MATITFNNEGIGFVLKDKLLIKSLIARIFSEEGVQFKSVSYIFCSDDFLLKLNQQYLNHDTLTDILTFTLSNSSLPIISEIYISVDRVKENAHDLHNEFISELYRVMIHGVLHLCGYTDASKHQKSKMRAREDLYLSKI